jgi:hypothetical protein
LDCRRSVLFVFWYHSPKFLDTPHICNISRLRVKRNIISGNDALMNITSVTMYVLII